MGGRNLPTNISRKKDNGNNWRSNEELPGILAALGTGLVSQPDGVDSHLPSPGRDSPATKRDCAGNPWGTSFAQVGSLGLCSQIPNHRILVRKGLCSH